MDPRRNLTFIYSTAFTNEQDWTFVKYENHSLPGKEERPYERWNTEGEVPFGGWPIYGGAGKNTCRSYNSTNLVTMLRRVFQACHDQPAGCAKPAIVAWQANNTHVANWVLNHSKMPEHAILELYDNANGSKLYEQPHMQAAESSVGGDPRIRARTL
jgi:hypothetical protein